MAITVQEQTVRTKDILVVDDDRATLFAYQMLFKQFAVTIHGCETLAHALELITARSFDAVITDLRLTGVGSEEGMDILRCLHRLRPETKVILVTGYGSEQVKGKAFALGASFYFEKPVHPVELFDALRKLQVLEKNDQTGVSKYLDAVG
jgi:DNA-binding NtrC family response regulator